jgi:phosphoglycolate phosphatase
MTAPRPLTAGRFRLVSFDLDGTLVDSAAEIVEACNLTFAEFGVAPRPYDDVVACIGHGTRELMTKQLARVLAAEPQRADQLRFEQVFPRFTAYYAQTAGTSARPFAGTLEALDLLHDHDVICVCVTNKEQQHAERVLDATGLSERFAMVVGGDLLPFKKPDRRVLEHVLQRFGVARHEAGHVGDSSIDVDTARAAGVAAWAVPYGYNGGRPVACSGPDGLFERLDELARQVCSGSLQPISAPG